MAKEMENAAEKYGYKINSKYVYYYLNFII